jgi:hypothetical protein
MAGLRFFHKMNGGTQAATGLRITALVPTIFVVYFPYSEKIKVGLCNHYAVSVSMITPVLTSECLNESL